MEINLPVALAWTGRCAKSRILRDRKERRRGKLKRSACLAEERLEGELTITNYELRMGKETTKRPEGELTITN